MSTKDDLNKAADNLYDTAHQAGRTARTLYNDTVNDNVDCLKTQIRRKPLEATLTALAVGFLIGKIF